MRPATALAKRGLAVLILASMLLPARGSAAEEPLAVQVNRAIEAGVKRIRAAQREDGSFGSGYSKDYPLGVTALALLTLVKSHAPPDDPQVAKAIEYLRYQAFRKTYGTAVLAMALDALNDPAHDEWIRRAGKWIDEHFNEGFWGYPEAWRDLSNTQFAVLGLWAAERHGYRARPEVWAKLLESVPTLQHDDGGFSYGRESEQTGAMTTAGVTILALALPRVPDEPRNRKIRRWAERALERGLQYLDRRFSVEANPAGSYHFIHDHHHYHLYGLERVAAITGRDRIGDRDWYREGARTLVATRAADGSWGGGSFESTCFALLFLRKATFTAMGGEAGPAEGEGVPTEPEPAVSAPNPGVPFVLRWLVLGPFANADDSFLSRSPIPEEETAPRAKASRAGLTWTPVRSRWDRVDVLRLPGAGDFVGYYAFTWLHVTMDADAVLWLGHDDGAKVWLDGRLIHEHHFHGRWGPGTFRYRVRLTKGVHRLLVKVENVQGPSDFSVCLTNLDGSAAREVLPSLAEKDREEAECALAQPTLFELPQLFRRLPVSAGVRLDFAAEADLDGVAIADNYPGWPVWFDEVEKGATGRIPGPGATGILGMHPLSREVPARLYHKVRLPAWARWLHVRASASPHSAENRGDSLVRLGVYDGQLGWIASQVVGPHSEAKPENWTDLRGYVGDCAGEEVLLIVEVAAGGARDWWAEEAFLDALWVTDR